MTQALCQCGNTVLTNHFPYPFFENSYAPHSPCETKLDFSDRMAPEPSVSI